MEHPEPKLAREPKAAAAELQLGSASSSAK
jgi:hypothetical protein